MERVQTPNETRPGWREVTFYTEDDGGMYTAEITPDYGKHGRTIISQSGQTVLVVEGQFQDEITLIALVDAYALGRREGYREGESVAKNQIRYALGL